MNLSDIPGIFKKLELLRPYHSHKDAPKVEMGCLVAKPEDKTEMEAALKAIEDFADGQAMGWACFAQELKVGIGNAGLSRDLGLLLSAEFVKGDVSLHVRHLGNKWRLTTITSRTGKEPTGFLVPHRFLSSHEGESGGKKGILHLEYEVFWTSPDATQPLRATLSRFTGFNKDSS